MSHFRLLHLLPNIAFQLLVGVPLELVHKIWRIAPIYLLAVIMGDFCKFLVPFLHCTFRCFDCTFIALKKHWHRLFLKNCMNWYRRMLRGRMKRQRGGKKVLKRAVLTKICKQLLRGRGKGGVADLFRGKFFVLNKIFFLSSPAYYSTTVPKLLDSSKNLFL